MHAPKGAGDGNKKPRAPAGKKSRRQEPDRGREKNRRRPIHGGRNQNPRHGRDQEPEKREPLMEKNEDPFHGCPQNLCRKCSAACTDFPG